MTLTVVVGSSGSGKTTFLNDVHKSHHCTYIRQYHNIRPYIVVNKIPHFDPKDLPYWNIYEEEGTASTIKAGGTMAGEFTAGLSGGQRKLLLFELIFQRFQNQHDLLVVFDEPFAGVTDDFVPFIVERLNKLRENHNILLVTNDHVDTLKKMGDNTITVSAIDRTTVKINDREKVDRETAILALGVGDNFAYTASSEDIKFFFEVEVLGNIALAGVLAFTVMAFSLFLASYWDSDDSSGPLVLIAGSFIAFFAINPYLLALVDWRIYMSEEAEALLHSSKSLNKLLKSSIVIFLLLVISLAEFGIVNAVVDGFESARFFAAMLMDTVGLTFSFIALGIYSEASFTEVQVLASLPFLLMIFFSTTFSPGAGMEGFKGLRYLFARFYFWCMIPGIKEDMEGCPDSDNVNLVLLIITAFLFVILFVGFNLITGFIKSMRNEAEETKKDAIRETEDFLELQVEIYGERARELAESRHSRSGSRHGSRHGSKHAKEK